MKNCTAKLKACRTYAEAEKILETNGVSVSGKELLRLGFAVKEKQPEIFENNMATVVREIEDEHDKKDEEVTETNDNTSNESSSTTGTENVADMAPHADTEGMNSSTDTKDQLGAIVNETGMHPSQMMPPQQGGMNQMPMQQNHMMGQQQCPPNMGMPPNPQQQMQYTMNQHAQMLNKMQEAIQTLNKKITEISKPSPRELDMSNVVGQSAGFTVSNPLKETISPSSDTQNEDRIQNYSAQIDAARRDIKSFNDFLHEKNSGVQ